MICYLKCTHQGISRSLSTRLCRVVGGSSTCFLHLVVLLQFLGLCLMKDAAPYQALDSSQRDVKGRERWIRGRLDWLLEQLRPVTDAEVSVVVSSGAALGDGSSEPLGRRRRESGSSRAIRIGVLCLVVILGVLLAVRNLAQPLLMVDAISGTATTMPLTLFVLGLIGFAVGWTLLLSGSYWSHWLLRVTLLVAFTLTFTLWAGSWLVVQASKVDT